MATESPLLHDGAQNTFSTASDGRRSSITGTTLGGPNGSAQFLCVVQSTTVDRTVALASSSPTLNVGAQNAYGVLQNTPGPGQAADVGIFGISKVVADSTGFTRGALIAPTTASTQNGRVAAYTTVTGLEYNPIGWALEAPTTSGAIITAFIFPSFKGTTA